jgi:aryl-alcohol dehydrogenase-like predicted oxidoreductase
VTVSRLCLGAMMFGSGATPITRPRSGSSTRAGCRHQLRRYGRCVLAGRVGGDRWQGAEGPARPGRTATKVHFPMGEDPNERGSSRRWIFRECEASLRRLGTDWIDLYQVHRWDAETDHDETLGALTDLVRMGRCAPSAPPPTRRARSSRRSGSRSRVGGSASSVNNRRTRC